MRRKYGPVTVPADHYFMMGDNRDNSQDSRYWGFMPRSYVKGKALFVYFSFGERRPERRASGGAGCSTRSTDRGARMKTLIKLLIAAVLINRRLGGLSAWTHYQFRDATQQMVLFGASQTTGELKGIVDEAAEQGVPLADEDVTVERQGFLTTAEVTYVERSRSSRAMSTR